MKQGNVGGVPQAFLIGPTGPIIIKLPMEGERMIHNDVLMFAINGFQREGPFYGMPRPVQGCLFGPLAYQHQALL